MFVLNVEHYYSFKNNSCLLLYKLLYCRGMEKSEQCYVLNKYFFKKKYCMFKKKILYLQSKQTDKFFIVKV
jgi:hypothetical protein